MLVNITTAGYHDDDMTMETVIRGYADSVDPTESGYTGLLESHQFGNITSNITTDVSPASTEAIIGLSLLFCIIGIVGLVGNALVIFIILSDKKMRRSVTNLFIMNLAMADLLIMLFGIPEIVQFVLNRGWLLGLALCKFQRFVLVVSLYASIMTLVAVCVERYIAIVHPIKAHILCSRRRIILAISAIWPVAFASGLPTALYNQIVAPPGLAADLCVILFPSNTKKNLMTFKLVEFLLYFLAPILIQVFLYTIVCRRLFVGTEKLHRKKKVHDENGGQRERDSDAIRARRGVVKMLMASVLVYFVSYAPLQIPLFYDMIAAKPFKFNWSFLVLVLTLGYINSAANPVLYSIFSQNFRRRFRRVLCCCCCCSRQWKDSRQARNPYNVVDSKKNTVRFSNSRLNTVMTSVSEM